MGLLDDAIREHLELKRRSGADPGEIAHEEHEALAPVFPDEETAVADGQLQPRELEADPERPDFEHVGQETAELDMSEVLDGGVAESSVPAEAESLEWEMARGIGGTADGAPPPQEIPGQERLTFE